MAMKVKMLLKEQGFNPQEMKAFADCIEAVKKEQAGTWPADSKVKEYFVQRISEAVGGEKAAEEAVTDEI